ncbi:MAG: pyridoxamine 5'-phosphate oxidase family protein [Syntrophales bacterium]
MQKIKKGEGMSRQDKEIKDFKILEAIMAAAPVCRLALAEDGVSYIVPMHFAYRDRVLHFHTGRKGRKIDLLRKNDRVCFEMDILDEIVAAGEACRWTTRYRSVIGYGRACLIDDPSEVEKSLDLLMEKYGGAGPWTYAARSLRQTLILRVAIASVTGKCAPALSQRDGGNAGEPAP